MPYIIPDQVVGSQPITESSNYAKHALGTVVTAKDAALGDGEFVYLKGVAGTVIGSVITYNQSDSTTSLSASTINKSAVAMSANIANQYGWYQISGSGHTTRWNLGGAAPVDPVTGATSRLGNLSLANTLVICADSLSANNWTTTSTNYKSINLNGVAETANAIFGQRFKVLDNVAVGGKTHAQTLTEQLQSILALNPRYCYIGSPYNDLYSASQTGAVSSANTIALIEALVAANIIPIWHTVHARTYDSVQLKQHLDCNDRLRRYAAATYCGIYWDAFRVNVDITNANCEPRAGWTLDAPTQVHFNNTQAYYQSLAMVAACKAFGLGKTQVFANGAEDQTNTVTGRSNLLVNPQFSGTTGTVGANCTGTMPTSWTVDWPTRTGTGSAAASIVDVLDADTGLAIAKGIQLVLSGTIAANDVLRVTQDTGFNTLLSAGDLMSAEGVVTLTSPVAIQEAAMRVQANTNESTWAGISQSASGGSIGGIPASDTFYQKTREIIVLGSGAATQARYDLRTKFNGAATGTIVLSQPRVRKG